MNSDVTLEFDRIWKKFRKGESHDSLRDLIPALTKRLFSGRRSDILKEKEFWALKDVSFQATRGEALGIIGPNGAGKSTVLKLLSRILRPNKGQINVRGKISALIEVGAGFHPDLTGRENIYLNGTILGMNRDEIKGKLDEIIDFSGIPEFIDTPVKRYSSGMYARLGFSIAVHVDPEILLVDEVLSVGDMRFQEKCLNKMLSIKDKGITIIFVSHNLAAVDVLCSRTAFLDHGQLKEMGPTSEVIKQYVCSNNNNDTNIPEEECAIWAVKLQDESRKDISMLNPGQKAYLTFKLRCNKPYEDCLLLFIVTRLTDGITVCDYNLPLKSITKINATGIVDSTMHFNANLLRGSYSISLFIYYYPGARHIAWAKDVAYFGIEERISWNGVAHLNPILMEPD